MTEAVAAIGHSPSLLAQLATIDAEIAKLDDRLTEMNQPRGLAVSLEDLREVLHQRAAEIGALLRGDAEVARLALAKYVDRLVLAPKGTPEGPVLEVSGSVEIFNGNGTGDGVCIGNGGQRRDRSFHGSCISVSYRKQNDKKSKNATSPGSAVQNWYKAGRTLCEVTGSAIR